MIEWREEGVVLACRRHGESAAIVEAFTEAHGRHAGIVRGGGGRRLAPLLQPGAQLVFDWSARLDDHLGAFRVEPVRSRAAVLSEPLALAALRAVTSLLAHTLPEREAQPALYRRSVALLDRLEDEDAWPLDYLHWEMALLEGMGFGLDLTRCAVTGSTEGLAFVSPKSGRAVSVAGAGEWADRLLPLPPCLLEDRPATAAELIQGLCVTGHFLARWLAPALGDRPLPAARERLVARMVRAFTA